MQGEASEVFSFPSSRESIGFGERPLLRTEKGGGQRLKHHGAEEVGGECGRGRDGACGFNSIFQRQSHKKKECLCQTPKG